ncbi:response regulator [Gracilinema caldarium]|uniref:Two component transcriptional regulator, LuxR family n=1 Tax=Gracilinema caldarium (strain ATCC 51460 / DSM 7334 / H1) TaxID=744872 RepID=F8F0W7_GRAC1|nr:response regulator transcription factor [Gracilinema caldarium]AEJ20253.1 two component transcriptional regulator, LuxR family [Gracilinema caldarium DSM 7334]
MERPIRVMIVDDHPVVRKGLVTFLETYDFIRVVAEAATGTEALELYDQSLPDVVLMDLDMPDMDGLSATARLQERHPESCIIILTSFKKDDQIQSALKAGAKGYLLKDIPVEELAKAIETAASGKPVLAPEVTQVLIQATTKEPNSDESALSEREQEVLVLMARGLNNAQIAESLFISISTVKFHVSNILWKLGAFSRTEAVSVAIKKGLVH